MPSNPISARSVVIVGYRETGVGEHHNLKFYLDCSCVRAVTGVITLLGVTNPATSSDWLIHDVVLELFRRPITEDSFAIGVYEILSVAVIQNETDPMVETFIGFDSSDYSDLVQSTTAGLGGWTLTYTFQSLDRSDGRIVFLDVPHPPGTRVPMPPSPVVDDDSLAWFITRSVVPFSTNDGEGLARSLNRTSNVNDKLLRRYGFAHNSTPLSYP